MNYSHQFVALVELQRLAEPPTPAELHRISWNRRRAAVLTPRRLLCATGRAAVAVGVRLQGWAGDDPRNRVPA